MLFLICVFPYGKVRTFYFMRQFVKKKRQNLVTLTLKYTKFLISAHHTLL